MFVVDNITTLSNKQRNEWLFVQRFIREFHYKALHKSPLIFIGIEGNRSEIKLMRMKVALEFLTTKWWTKNKSDKLFFVTNYFVQ